MDYTRIYNQIIERAQNRKLDGYVEKHHIVPKCIGGLDVKENLVELTAREHFLCHRLLCEIYPKQPKLWYALWLMTIGKQRWITSTPYDISSREYENIRIEFVKRISGKSINEQHKNKIGKSNSKQVNQYSTSGEYIKTFSSAADAERSINNLPTAHWRELKNNINDCCRGKQKTAYGYIWKYEEDLLNLKDHNGSNNCKIGKKIQYRSEIYHNIEHFKKQFNLSNYMFKKLIQEKTIIYVN